MRPSLLALTATAAALVLGTAGVSANSLTRSVSGVASNGVTWTAESRLVGTGSTATLIAGGNPVYTVPSPLNGGIVSLVMNYSGFSGVCTGTLLDDRRSILTAAHCVTDSMLNLPLSTEAYFYGGNDPDTPVGLNPASTLVAVETYKIPSAYTGDVIDQNDIAVLRLAAPAPAFAPSFSLFDGDIEGESFNVMGYGLRSLIGGSYGAHLSSGRLRQGENRYDYRMGDAAFGSAWADLIGVPLAQVEHSWLSDFDSGLAENDVACRSAQELFSLGADPRWCDLGRGLLEVALAGGDSGGPGFINGRIASVNSYGLTFNAPGYGDVDPTLNSSFGEFSGYVPVYLHTDFIAAAMAVPEPGTGSFAAAGLLVVGALVRRRLQGGAR